MNVVEDPVQLPVGGTGRGASPANLIGFTLGDVLKKASPASRVVGVATKDRSAVLLAGRRADAAYWYESAHGGFITSTYYMSEAPPWLAAWNAQALRRPLRHPALDAPAARGEDLRRVRGRGPAARGVGQRGRRVPALRARQAGRARLLRRLPPHALGGRDDAGLRAGRAGRPRPREGRRHRPARGRLRRHRLHRPHLRPGEPGGDGPDPPPRPHAGPAAGGGRPPRRPRPHAGGALRRPRLAAAGGDAARERQRRAPRGARRSWTTPSGTRWRSASRTARRWSRPTTRRTSISTSSRSRSAGCAAPTWSRPSPPPSWGRAS